MSSTEAPRQHFIRQIINDDLAAGKINKLITRFPPEPNGYLHVGHAKSICLNFGLAEQYQGECYLRFDDTNPTKEEQEYVDAIIADVEWLGFSWHALTHASDCFEEFYEFAMELIAKGLAYVDSSSAEEIREMRGTLQQPGKNSPYRDRSVAENRDLFTRMRAGEFAEGEHVLRAKIDMSSPNINMRDPVIYRIRHASHQRTGNAWCIYPMYDFAHPLTDALEKITHSLCTLEFQDHRPLYDWLIEHCSVPSQPKQYEFARLNLSHTIASKRKLRQLVEENHVQGWDDPRLPTLKGMRRRGYPASALRNFCDQIGISKSDSVIEMTQLEDCVREALNETAPRVMCVLDPLKVVITNFTEQTVQQLTAARHPNDETQGTRTIPFSDVIYIERDDFMEHPAPKYFRLSPGSEVRLRHAYIIRCDDVIKDAAGNITELRCSVDHDTLGKMPTDRKVKGVIHWVAASTAKTAEVRLYDRLFTVPNPTADDDITEHLNHASLSTLTTCYIEPDLGNTDTGQAFQFERQGYFAIDPDSKQQLVFNRVVSLRDTWSIK